MTAYYNEFDPYAAQWLRNLIAAGHIAPGDVDERSIALVQPDDLKDYTQCHFFAGIGGWSRALRLAGWADDRPVWTGSCPCQPFSAAGKRQGEKDERHLWPEFRRLIAECAPAIALGEQVASKDGRLWLAGVRADLETLGYAVGAADLCAAGVGAPHIRQRLWWVAERHCERAEGERSRVADADGGVAGNGHLQSSRQHGQQPQDGGAVERMADTDQGQRRRLADSEGRQRDGQKAGRLEGNGVAQSGGAACGLGDTGGDDLGRIGRSASGAEAQSDSQRRENGLGGFVFRSAGATSGLGNADKPRLERRGGRI